MGALALTKRTRWSLFFGLAALVVAGRDVVAESAARVYLNGVPSQVTFNDGDSFRVLAGPLEGSKARLAGFNTLESHGPVHQWGEWTAKELYFLAKMATLNGRQGVWHCTSDMKKDGYGRVLWDCPDLVEDQIRKGYAHALTVTESPAPEKYLALQREAQAAKRGIWAHGAPEYIITSTHSAAEAFAPGELPYNRLVSSVDGHSKKWRHNKKYEECENVCYVPAKLDPAKVTAAAEALKADPKLSKALEAVPVEALAAAITTFIDRTGNFPPDLLPEKLQDDVAVTLDELRESGALGELDPSQQSCMIYTDFERRFGSSQATCLK